MRRAFLICVLVSQGFCGEYGGGDGTSANPYVIASVEHLLELGATPEDYEAHFVLAGDLNMAGTVYTQAVIAPDLDHREWGPQGKKFNGVFDGGGHSIRNFTAENRKTDYLALIGFSDNDAVIKNLHVVDASVKGNNMVSCLIAGLEGTIENCSVTGELEGVYVIGGMVGFLDNACVRDSTCDVAIRAYEESSRFDLIGGLVASSQFGRIENCFGRCRITANDKLHMAGGLVGSNRNGTIINSYCEGVEIVSKISANGVGAFCGHNGGTLRNCLAFGFEVQCKGFGIGGLVGTNDSLIAMSVAEGLVVGMSGSGGIAGINDGYIIDSYSNVTSAAVERVGGFAGSNSYGILRSYSTGKALSVRDKAGGFVGDNTGLVDLSFFDTEKSRTDFDPAAAAKRTSELKKKETFKYWGNGVWVVDEDSDYPRLAWENSPGVVIEDEPVEYGGGSGTAADPYLIYEAEHLKLIGVYPQDIEKHFKLMSDIDMQGVEFRGVGYGFGFGGVFDGNGHVIRNCSVNNELPFSGLFTVVLKSGVLRDVIVEDFTVCGVRSVGGLCGKNDGLIERCKASGLVYASGKRQNNTSWGGLVGSNYGRIVQCVSDVKVEVMSSWMGRLGGFVGVNCGVVEKSGSFGEIFCGKKMCRYIGGFMGLGGYDSQVYDCYSRVSLTVTGEGCELVGGFAGGQGFRTTIRRSYCSAPVILGDDCKDGGAFIGYVNVVQYAAHSRITDCFWNSDFAGPRDGIARESFARVEVRAATSEQLKDSAFLESAGWDVSSVPHEKVWLVDGGNLPLICVPQGMGRR